MEDTEYTVEDMERIFGPKIAKMVDGLTKMSGVFNADTSEQAEYFRKVLLTLSDDVRVILIKIADRLHNMRTLGSMPTNKQIKSRVKRFTCSHRWRIGSACTLLRANSKTSA